jgi:16S rRNA (uracil1498-N3)-methyltransferase
MHRFYLPPNQSHGPTLVLTGAEAHHGLQVLRVRLGEQVLVLNGEGIEFHCQVQALTRDTIALKVTEKRTLPPISHKITLLQSLPKGKIIESIIQKATELGVFRLVPILSERVVVKLDDQEAARKQAKWQAIAIEALKQSGSPWLPKVEAPARPRDFLARNEKFDLPLIASLEEGSHHARKWFSEFRNRERRSPESVCVWIGPEGDFSPEETKMIRAAGCLPITLGPQVLRVETASIYCLSVINYELSAP